MWHRAVSPCCPGAWLASCRKCAHARTHTPSCLYLPLPKPSMAMTRPRTEVGHSSPPPSSACCQLSVSSSLDLQTDYSGRLGTWLHRIPKRCPARKPNGPGSHAFAGLVCARRCALHHLAPHMSPMPARLTSGPRNALSHEAVIRCRHDSAARSPYLLLCCAPSANAGYSFRYFKVASMKHGEETAVWSFARGST